MTNDPVILSIDMGPGGIMVVGPNGKFRLNIHQSGITRSVVRNCDFIDPEVVDMTEAHLKIVDERWAIRNENGDFPVETASLLIPPGLIKPLTAKPRDEEIPPPVEGKADSLPWWKFWGKTND